MRRNWIREPNPQSSPYDHAYRYKGEGYIRFSEKEHAQEYMDLVNGKVFVNFEGQKPRQVSVAMADRDLRFAVNNYPTEPKYYNDIWISREGVMKDF